MLELRLILSSRRNHLTKPIQALCTCWCVDPRLVAHDVRANLLQFLMECLKSHCNICNIQPLKRCFGRLCVDLFQLLDVWANVLVKRSIVYSTYTDLDQFSVAGLHCLPDLQSLVHQLDQISALQLPTGRRLIETAFAHLLYIWSKRITAALLQNLLEA